MLNFIERFKRPSATAAPGTAPTAEVAELLGNTTLPDPGDLWRCKLAFEEAAVTCDARWEALDQQPSPRASLEQTVIAERLEQLRLQIAALETQIATAEARRAAFLKLVRLLSETDETIATLTEELYACVFVADEAERRARFTAIDAQIRLRGRVVAALASVSRARRFRRDSPDPFGALRHDLRARADEIDRFHAPGTPRPAIPWPAGAQELIASLNGGNRS